MDYLVRLRNNLAPLADKLNLNSGYYLVQDNESLLCLGNRYYEKSAATSSP